MPPYSNTGMLSSLFFFEGGGWVVKQIVGIKERSHFALALGTIAWNARAEVGGGGGAGRSFHRPLCSLMKSSSSENFAL